MVRRFVGRDGRQVSRCRAGFDSSIGAACSGRLPPDRGAGEPVTASAAASGAVCEGLVARRDRGALWLTLARPHHRNAMTSDMVSGLLAQIRAADADPSVGVVVLTGEGEAFCAGADLTALGAGGEGDDRYAPLRDGMRNGSNEVVRAVWAADVPVIAGVNGVAAGLGANLALAADVVVATRSARFAQVFAKRGLAADTGGAWLLPRLVGLARAKRMLLLAETLTADEAFAMGLVAFVPPDDQYDAVLADVVARLAGGPRFALAMTKRLVNRGTDESLAASLEVEALTQELVVRHPDFGEGVRAWVERRPPAFGGSASG